MSSKQTVKSEVESSDESIAPAGGKSDAETVRDFAKALRSEGAAVHIGVGRPYARIALETAIPTAIVVTGVVMGVAALTVIDNKWGNGRRVNRLLDNGELSKIVESDGMLVAKTG